MDAADNFRNLLLMAVSDGQMAESELRLLSDRATQWGVTDDEFGKALRDAISGRVALTLPTDSNERIEILKDMIRMMAADGVMTDSEKQLFAVASGVMGIGVEHLNGIIDEVLEDDGV